MKGQRFATLALKNPRFVKLSRAKVTRTCVRQQGSIVLHCSIHPFFHVAETASSIKVYFKYTCTQNPGRLLQK